MISKNKELQEYLNTLLKDDLDLFLSAKSEPRSIRLNTLKIDSIQQSTFLNKNKEPINKKVIYFL